MTTGQEKPLAAARRRLDAIAGRPSRILTRHASVEARKAAKREQHQRYRQSQKGKAAKHAYYMRHQEREQLKRRKRHYEKQPAIEARAQVIATTFSLFSEPMRHAYADFLVTCPQDEITRKAVKSDALGLLLGLRTTPSLRTAVCTGGAPPSSLPAPLESRSSPSTPPVRGVGGDHRTAPRRARWSAPSGSPESVAAFPPGDTPRRTHAGSCGT